MKEQAFFLIAALVLVIGTTSSIYIVIHRSPANYPKLITDAYKGSRHVLTVPGAKEVQLIRTGAYGIYFEHDLVSSIYPEIDIPPEINCALTSKVTGAVIDAVPDYVKTNRYRSRDLHAGVLIMSITVNKPGNYTFACDYHDLRNEPEFMVALGPNYFWEFLRVIWKIGLPVLGSCTISCGSVLLALLLLVMGIVFRTHNANKLEVQK